MQVFVKPDVPDSLLTLRREYAVMLMKLKTARLPKKSLQKLKEFLSSFCNVNAIETCSTLKKVIDCLTEKSKISIFNIYTLEMCAHCKEISFPVVNGPVEQYKEQLRNFRFITSVQELEHLVLSKVTSQDDFESLTLKLDDNRDSDTLEYLRQLTYYCFGVNSKAFILFKICKGCVSITWFVPTSLVSTLRETAEQHSPKYFSSFGILKVVIGQQVVYNNNNEG